MVDKAPLPGKFKLDNPLPTMPKNQTADALQGKEAASGQEAGTDNRKKYLLAGLVIGLLCLVGGLLFLNSGGKKTAKEATNLPSAPTRQAQTYQASPPASPPPQSYATQGHIRGNEVIMRSGPSTASARVAVLYNNNPVTILDRYTCEDPSAAMLTSAVTVYLNRGSVTFQYGQAIKIISDDGGYVVAEIEYADGARSVRTNINKNNMKRLYGETWYRVRTSSGSEGYVYGEYVQSN